MGLCQSMFDCEEYRTELQKIGLLIDHYEYIVTPNESLDDHVYKLAQLYPDNKKHRIRWETVNGKTYIYVYDKTKVGDYYDGMF